jgi:hypothetical protein
VREWVRSAQVVAVAGLLVACGSKVTDYATLAEAQTAGVVAQGLLPDALPPSAALIRIERDETSPSGYFHFSSADFAPLVARLMPLADMPADPQLQSWVKRKDLAGYDAFTQRQGAANWLLLCAQNKGRCYFRRLG